ncbi:hypothetical protein [Streptomyces flaveus]|jgi:hypothetical protein|uniref:hypothetical protein n=1 Tax=Streptomyces flaveus TaxID=66370 RepID=UPI003331B2AD
MRRETAGFINFGRWTTGTWTTKTTGIWFAIGYTYSRTVKSYGIGGPAITSGRRTWAERSIQLKINPTRLHHYGDMTRPMLPPPGADLPIRAQRPPVGRARNGPLGTHPVVLKNLPKSY